MGPRGRSGWGFGPWAFGFGCETPQSGPGFKWRFYDRGDLKFVILRLLKDRAMHGYEVMRALEEESGGWYRASAGSVYPTLQMLEDQGYIASQDQEGKKVYSITDAGRKYLDENRDVVEDIVDRVSDFTSGIFREGMSDLTRSFGRLANVTFERAVRHRGNQEVIAKMREIIDRAVQDLEGVRPSRDHV
jgi:DNA-binding PadR family transcriptional regulator